MCVLAAKKVNKGEKKVYLKDHEEEEVGIGEPPELLKQIKRQEGENVVFGGFDGIFLKWRRETDACEGGHAVNSNMMHRLSHRKTDLFYPNLLFDSYCTYGILERQVVWSVISSQKSLLLCQRKKKQEMKI